MSERFYWATAPGDCKATGPGQTISIEGAEAHHMARVMRLQPGEWIVLFDGRGHEFDGQIARISVARVQIEIRTCRAVNVGLSGELTIAAGLPQGDRQKFLVEKLVEIGAARLVPLVSDRSLVHPKPNTVAKLERAVIEATKQCGRSHLMQIASTMTLAQLLSQTETPTAARWFADRNGTAFNQLAADDLASQRIVVATGPPGGWTDPEVEAFRQANWRGVNLSPTTLRSETAALAAAILFAKHLRPV